MTATNARPEFQRSCVDPVYRQIETFLRQQIMEGRLKPETQLPPENILARQYGVSPLTLRRALGRLVHDGLLRRKQRKGTFVADYRTLQIPKRHCVMVIAPIETLTFFRDEYYGGIMRGAEPVLREHECDLLLVSKREESYASIAGKNPSVDGIMVVSILRSQLDDLMETCKSGTPLVVVGPNAEGTRLVSISADRPAGGSIAVQYLIAKGCRRLGFVGVDRNHSEVVNALMRARLRGCRKALHAHGLLFDNKHYVELPWDNPPARLPELEALIRSQRLDGLVVLAAGTIGKTAVAYLRYMELNIPKDIRVVGFDDWGGVFSKQGIPYVRNPTEEMGQAAAQALIAMMKRQGNRPPSRVLPVELVGLH